MKAIIAVIQNSSIPSIIIGNGRKKLLFPSRNPLCR